MPSLHRDDLPASAAPHPRRRRRRNKLAAASSPSRPRLGRRGRLRLGRELVHVGVVVPGAAAEGQELRLEAVVVMMRVAGGVAHGREKGILARLPHGRGLQVRELEDGGLRRFLVLLRFLVELQQAVMVVVLLLLICSFPLPASASSSYAVASVRNPVVVPRIQIPRLQLRLRYYRPNALPSSSPDPITRRGVGD